MVNERSETLFFSSDMCVCVEGGDCSLNPSIDNQQEDQCDFPLRILVK